MTMNLEILWEINSVELKKNLKISDAFLTAMGLVKMLMCWALAKRLVCDQTRTTFQNINEKGGVGVCVLPDTKQPSPSFGCGCYLPLTYLFPTKKCWPQMVSVSSCYLTKSISSPSFPATFPPTFQLAHNSRKEKGNVNWHQGQMLGSQTMASPFLIQAGKDAFRIRFSFVCSN